MLNSLCYLNINLMDTEFQTLLDSLAQTPEIIARQIGTLSNEELRWKNSEDEFSAVENVCHLRDLEVEAYALRINRILNEQEPSLPDFDGGRVAVERDYNHQDIQEALEAFALARKQNVNTLRQLAPARLTREGILEGVGRVSLKGLLSMMREHDEGHLQTLVSL